MDRELFDGRVKNIEAGFEQFMPKEEGYQKTVFEAMNYSILAGGKRLRPMFMQTVYEMFGGNDEEVIRPFMMAMEMIHTYSLVHDDLPAMDNDDYRRGKLTTHKKYGEAMGILTGDALLNAAYETAFGAFDSKTDKNYIAGALRILGKKAGVYGMVGGQVVDVEQDGSFVDEQTLLFVHKNKTSALIEASLMIGAVLAGASEEEVKTIESVGTDIGLAFQIQDDILDIVGDEKIIGKPVHSDEKNQKTTWAFFFGIDASRNKVTEYTERGISRLRGITVKNEEAREFLCELMMSLVDREK